MQQLLVRRGVIRSFKRSHKKGVLIDEVTGECFPYQMARFRRFRLNNSFEPQFGSKAYGRENFRPRSGDLVAFIVQPLSSTVHKLAYWEEWERILQEAGLPLSTDVIHV